MPAARPFPALLPALSLALLAWIGAPATGVAQDVPEAAAEEDESPIHDNSFLVEEAYNQEQGVIQHIFNLVPAWEHGRSAERTVDFVFTQEWPIFSQRHQFSYTLPLRRIDGMPEIGYGTDAGGLGDIMLNYRLQVLDGGNEAFPLAVAPRASVIFPSGDAEAGLGNGKLGYQFNLPMSYELEKWAFHFNAGLTKTDGVTAGLDPDAPFLGHTIDGYNLGASAIYFLRPHFNLMLETVAYWNEELLPDGREDPQFQAIVLPGFRWAPYTEGDTQWVVGCGVPIGLSADAPDVGIFFYMSFEHRFLRKK
jgi:hypothetical protein